jgi:hypothetical protein
MPYVYRHIRLDKNEPFYIGIGSDMTNKRANERARRSELWKKIVAKSEYEIEILMDDITFEEAKSKEIEFIKLYGRIDLGNGTLANLTDGGDGAINRIFTPEHRRKLSLSQIGKEKSEKIKDKLRKYRIGKFNSPEARLKISKANKGRINTPELMELLRNRKGKKNPAFGITGAKCKNFKGFIQVFKNGVYLGQYEGIRDCAESLGVTATKVSAVLNGRRNHTGGYTFKRISHEAEAI